MMNSTKRNATIVKVVLVIIIASLVYGCVMIATLFPESKVNSADLGNATVGGGKNIDSDPGPMAPDLGNGQGDILSQKIMIVPPATNGNPGDNRGSIDEPPIED